LQLTEPFHLLVLLLGSRRHVALVLGCELRTGLLSLFAMQQVLSRQLLIFSPEPLLPLLV
jgi:hypothetical protein